MNFRFAILAGLALSSPLAVHAQKADTTFAYAKQNSDGARYVWHLYAGASYSFPFIPASEYPTSPMFKQVHLDSAQAGDVAYWKDYVAVYGGYQRAAFLTAEGDVPVQALVRERGIPQIYRRTIPRYEVPEGADIYAVVTGTWGWAEGETTCQNNPHTISFNADRSQMMIEFQKDFAPRKDRFDKENSKAHYEIRGHSRSHIRGFMLDEKRLTDGGELVVWDLVLTSPDSYRWRQTDWPEDGFTGEIVRCSQ